MNRTRHTPSSLAPGIIALGFMLFASHGASANHEISRAWFGQYISTKKTTMTVQPMEAGSRYDFVIDGRGEFSMYKAYCNVVGRGVANCMGKGTRLSDRQRYNGRYRLKLVRGGLASNWVVVYPGNGRSFSGRSVLERL